jgi:hypothetical protein
MSWDGTVGVIRLDNDNNKTVLDFGVAAGGGDQYSEFTFRNDDIQRFTSGDVKTLRGLYEDGFDWTNGYNTRAQIVVECK